MRQNIVVSFQISRDMILSIRLQWETKFVCLIDLPRTIMSAAGYSMDKKMQGHALQNMEGTEWQRAIYVQISESYVMSTEQTTKPYGY